MLKKSLSVVLAVIMLFGFAAIPTFASSDDIVIDEAVVDSVVESAIKELVGADEGDKIIVDKALAKEIANEAGNEVTAKAASASLSNYFFVKPEDVPGLSDSIVGDSVFTVKVLSNGKSTVYIAVDIESHPEIMNLDVFKETVKKLAAKQNDYANTPDVSYDLMSYQHIAGELALHTMIYALANLTNQTSEGSPLYSYYIKAKIADLNIDESRFPTDAIKLIGTIIMDYIVFSLNSIFAVFA